MRYLSLLMLLFAVGCNNQNSETEKAPELTAKALQPQPAVPAPAPEVIRFDDLTFIPDIEGHGRIVVDGTVLPKGADGRPVIRSEWARAFSQENPLYVYCGEYTVELWNNPDNTPAPPGYKNLEGGEAIAFDSRAEQPAVFAQSIGPGVDVTSGSGTTTVMHDDLMLTWAWGDAPPDTVYDEMPTAPPYPPVTVFSPPPPAPWKPLALSQKGAFALCVQDYADVELNGMIREGAPVAAFPIAAVGIHALMMGDPPSADLQWIILSYPDDGALKDPFDDTGITRAMIPYTLKNKNDEVLYTPNAGFVGTNSFTFKLNDGFADSNIATVLINVTPANQPPIAGDVTTEIIEGTVEVPITLPGSDPDGP